ncbi:MAG: radical SAM mobile pair protein B [Treponemataceae bacterium]|nr:MAG: radical SAM mobile pair protein B [Treponemataceae bacterium]
MVILREIEAKSIVAKTRIPAGDYVINPYIGCPHKCLYCYAEFMKRFTNHHETWGDFLDIKRYAKKLNAARLGDKRVIISSATDAYNPFEKKYRVTRDILQQFVNTQARVCILTKSDLLLRDIDLFKRIPNISAAVSLNTLDDSVRKKLEPFASSVERRISAIKILHDEGIPTAVFLSPIFPGITDYKAVLLECSSFANEFWFENLNLRGGYRSAVMRYIREYHKNLTALYDDIYKHKNIGYWDFLEKEITAFCKKNNIAFISYFYHEKIRKQ